LIFHAETRVYTKALTPNRRMLPRNVRSVSYHLPCKINDTYDSQTEENNFYDSKIIAKKLSEMRY